MKESRTVKAVTPLSKEHARALWKDVVGDPEAEAWRNSRIKKFLLWDIEQSIDELRNSGHADLELPFVTLVKWIKKPRQNTVDGWTWPLFVKETDRTWCPALKHAGMEIQKNCLKTVVSELARVFKKPEMAETLKD